MKILIGGICEQDIDLFLLEECASNRSFLSWLLAQIPGWPQDSLELVAAARSVDQGNGESDLELTLVDEAGRPGKVLIENKLAAAFQPQQLARYRERAEMYVARGDCVRCAVVLFAPSTYVRSVSDVDAIVPYEAVESWLAGSEPDERIGYKLQLLRCALEKHRLGYNPATDDAVTRFWHSYWREASTLAPELQLEEPGPRPAGAGFVWFFPTGLPANLNLCHKLPKGVVDLHLPEWGDRLHRLKDEVQALLEPQMEVVKANKSAAIRIAVPPLNTGSPFGGQADAVCQGLHAARQLYAWADRHRSRLIQLFAEATEDAD